MEDKSKYVRLLKVIKKIFEKHDITYWLDYGTLAGAMELGTIVPWDDDIDVGVFLKDVPRISQLKQEFKKEGFDLRINKNHLNYVLHNITTGEHIGCILFRTAMDNYMVRIHFNPVLKPILILANIGSGGQLIKKFWQFIIKYKFWNDEEVSSRLENLGNLSKIDFYGEKFPIPCKPIPYLDWTYRDWKTVVHMNKKATKEEIGRRRLKLKEVLKNES